MLFDLLTLLAIAVIIDWTMAGITGRGLFNRLHSLYQAVQDTKYSRNKDR